MIVALFTLVVSNILMALACVHSWATTVTYRKKIMAIMNKPKPDPLIGMKICGRYGEPRFLLGYGPDGCLIGVGPEVNGYIRESLKEWERRCDLVGQYRMSWADAKANYPALAELANACLERTIAEIEVTL